MPLLKGSSQKTMEKNFHEFRHGKTFARTAAKFGKERAEKQLQAVVLSTARKGRAAGGPVGLGAPAATLMGSNAANASSGLGAALQGGPMGLAGGLAKPFQKGGAANRAAGGFNMAKAPNLSPSWLERGEAKAMTRGPILSAVPGRTDHHFTHVPSGSYVIPADIVSGRGQGNTIAGAGMLQKLFRMGPYGGVGPKLALGKGAVRGGFPKPPKAFKAGGTPTDEAHVGKPVRVNLAGGEVVVPPENLKAVVHKDLKTAHEIMDRWVINERKKLRKTLAKLPGPVKA